ncbi:MAG TPA: dihydrodipicolinate synthase family protein [bacterium]|nr:dihydrodipicolinate synthase family protein [bacterium]
MSSGATTPMPTTRALQGVFPIVPTIFDDHGDLDDAGQRSTLDVLLRAGVHGLVVLANASEGYAVGDAERTALITSVVTHVRGRVPVVATCNHPSTAGAVRFAREAEALGADAVMFLPPFFGQWVADLDGIRRHCEAISRATRVPLILQDHPLSGIVMPAPFLAELARAVERLGYFKVETGGAPAKIGAIRRLGGDALQGLFGGAAGLLFLEELDHGAAGTMPSSLLPDVFVRMLALYREDDRTGAAQLLARYLPLVTFEIHLGGQRAVKEVLLRAGIIRSAYVRGPIRGGEWDEQTAASFRRLIDGLDLLTLMRSS